MVKRREFITLLGGAAVTWPLAAWAQPERSRQRRLGMLLTSPQDSRNAETAAYGRWLEEVGWKPTANLDLEIRWTTGNEEHLRDQVADIASLSPDVILVESASALSAMRQAAPSIPIVFIMVGDPVGSGFVQSLSHPGGSITGFTNFEPSMGGKWLEVLKEIAPSTAIAAVLVHPDNPLHVKYWNSAEAASQVVGVSLRKMEVRGADDIERAFARLPTDSDHGLIVFPHFVTVSHRKSIIGLAGKHRIPAVYGVRFFATDGGLERIPVM